MKIKLLLCSLIIFSDVVFSLLELVKAQQITQNNDLSNNNNNLILVFCWRNGRKSLITQCGIKACLEVIRSVLLRPRNYIYYSFRWNCFMPLINMVFKVDLIEVCK